MLKMQQARTWEDTANGLNWPTQLGLGPWPKCGASPVEPVVKISEEHHGFWLLKFWMFAWRYTTNTRRIMMTRHFSLPSAQNGNNLEITMFCFMLCRKWMWMIVHQVLRKSVHTASIGATYCISCADSLRMPSQDVVRHSVAGFLRESCNQHTGTNF